MFNQEIADIKQSNSSLEFELNHQEKINQDLSNINAIFQDKLSIAK